MTRNNSRWGWGMITVLMLAMPITITLAGCTPTEPPADEHVIDTRARSIPAPLCTDKQVIISEPCSKPLQDTARGSQTHDWRFYPHKGDDVTFTDVKECPHKGTPKLPCMAVPRGGSDELAGTPTFLTLNT